MFYCTIFLSAQTLLRHMCHYGYLRNECEKTFFAHDRIIWGRATRERVLHLRECVEYVFPHRISYNIFWNEHYVWFVISIPFVNRMALIYTLAKVSIELIKFVIIKIFRMLKKANAFWMISRTSASKWPETT
jgi:hypothetical protein